MSATSYRQLEEAINKWTLELEEQEKVLSLNHLIFNNLLVNSLYSLINSFNIHPSIKGVPEPSDPGQRLGQDDGQQRREDRIAQRGRREGQAGPAGL